MHWFPPLKIQCLEKCKDYLLSIFLYLVPILFYTWRVAVIVINIIPIVVENNNIKYSELFLY